MHRRSAREDRPWNPDGGRQGRAGVGGLHPRCAHRVRRRSDGVGDRRGIRRKPFRRRPAGRTRRLLRREEVSRQARPETRPESEHGMGADGGRGRCGSGLRYAGDRAGPSTGVRGAGPDQDRHCLVDLGVGADRPSGLGRGGHDIGVERPHAPPHGRGRQGLRHHLGWSALGHRLLGDSQGRHQPRKGDEIHSVRYEFGKTCGTDEVHPLRTGQGVGDDAGRRGDEGDASDRGGEHGHRTADERRVVGDPP